MFTIKNYVRAESLEQAWELNQKRSNAVLGGLLWLKMGTKPIGTAIDLSNLGLGGIEETQDAFFIGAGATLRELETHSGLERCFHGAVREAVRHIVGVQFRNLATVGGSVYSRFGFSDPLTCFLALDAFVETYPGGIVPLEEYIGRPKENEILLRVILKKDGRQACYLSQRPTATDFPTLNCAVSRLEGRWTVVLGARPGKAMRLENSLSVHPAGDELETFLREVSELPIFGGNLRGSREYRALLSKVLIRRAVQAVEGGALHEN